MAEPTKSNGLQLDSDVALQERMWLAERIGWILTALVLVAALLGAFGGSGPLNQGHYDDPDGSLSVKYQRMARHATETSLEVRFLPQGRQAELWISNVSLEGLSLQRVLPEPQSVARNGDRTYFRFDAVTPSEPLAVEFVVTPTGYGPLVLGIGATDRTAASMSVFVYP